VDTWWGALVLGHSRGWDSREVLDRGPMRPSWWEVLGGQRVGRNGQTSVIQSWKLDLRGLGVRGTSSRALQGVGGWRAVGPYTRRSVVWEVLQGWGWDKKAHTR
jgi:hypothetical protein